MKTNASNQQYSTSMSFPGSIDDLSEIDLFPLYVAFSIKLRSHYLAAGWHAVFLMILPIVWRLMRVNFLTWVSDLCPVVIFVRLGDSRMNQMKFFFIRAKRSLNLLAAS